MMQSTVELETAYNICSTLGTSIAATFVPDLGEVSATFWYVTIDHAILVPRWEQILQNTLGYPHAKLHEQISHITRNTQYVTITIDHAILVPRGEQILQSTVELDTAYNICSTLGTSTAAQCRVRPSYD